MADDDSRPDDFAVTSSSTTTAAPRGKKVPRDFDFNKYPKRHIALRLAYHGHRHDGLAKQDHTANTVEGLVLEALHRVRLIHPTEGVEKFSRCGRTDKGVSALGNAFSLMLRASPDDSKPLDYCDMLNHALPPTVRIVGWSFVDDTFDARFSCKYRVYRYYFVSRGLDLERMRKAASYLVGSHSFRNFCKLDVVNVDNFVRHVMAVRIAACEDAPELVSFFEIQGNAFLYHQIRCTMTVLFLVGRGLEEPEVVKALLERGDAKPQYPLADDSPLVLWDCNFGDAVQWQLSPCAHERVAMETQDIATALMVRSVAAMGMTRQLDAWYPAPQEVPSPSPSSTSVDAPSDAPARAAAASSRTVSSSSLCTDNTWDATGCDWTREDLQPLLFRLRHHELHVAKKRLVSANGSGNGYVRLLERESEPTYDDRVHALSGAKKARHEVNQSKKKR